MNRNRNERPESDGEIAQCLRHRFGRIHGQELTDDKVKKARQGNAALRRQIELAGGGSLLPPIRQSFDFRNQNGR